MSNTKHKIFIGYYNKSVILTYIGVIFAILGILGYNNDKMSLICLLIAGLCDLFDGTIARMCKRTESEKEFGVQIDSLADIVSFVVLPTSIFANVVDSTNLNIWLKLIIIIISVLYIVTGITRLAWFNVHTANGKSDHYTGLPVTCVAFIVPITYVLHNVIGYSDIVHIVTQCILHTLIAILFVANIKIKKAKGVWYIVFSILAVLTFIGLVIW